MRFQPKSLRSPDPQLAVVRLTDFTDRGMARYRLAEVDDDGQELEALLEFYGPSDYDVEEFVLAWHKGYPFRLTPGRYIWYAQARYREATCFARLLLNSFSGIWLALSDAKTLA